MKTTAILDRLLTYRPIVAHFLLAVFAAGLLVVVRVIIGAAGVTGVADWPAVWRAALDAAALAAAGLIQVGLLAATKLTTSFGRGKGEHVADTATE